jgi:hypothetical protein
MMQPTLSMMGVVTHVSQIRFDERWNTDFVTVVFERSPDKRKIRVTYIAELAFEAAALRPGDVIQCSGFPKRSSWRTPNGEQLLNLAGTALASRSIESVDGAKR